MKILMRVFKLFERGFNFVNLNKLICFSIFLIGGYVFRLWRPILYSV